MKIFLKLVMSNPIDTKVETGVIEKSEAAEKKMHGFNSINQQVISVHISSDPQKGVVAKALPDYPCIEFTLRIQDIRKWQRALQKLMASILINTEAIEEIK